ncbi:MAG: hypothetical protein U0270_36900 [Labilithrix sp.]
MMRILPVLVLSTLALTTVGCAAEDASSSFHGRRGSRMTDEAESTTETGTTGTSSQAVTVNGTVDNVEAKKVDIMAMDDKGDLTKVGTADVKDGKFNAEIPANASPTGVFILKAKNAADSVVNSGLINGLPAFIKGFGIDVPLDTLTTFKAEVLQTIAKKGTPGAQNYINVLDAYIDGNLAGVIAVDSVLTNDVAQVVGATAEAVIAAEEVIEDALRKAGLPVDFDALQKAQASTVSGFQGFLLDASNKRISSAKNLVAGFEKTLADIAKPIDDAIFNAVVNGGGAFGAKMKEKAPAQSFAASKSAFKLSSALSSDKMNAAFLGTDLEGMVKDAANAFITAVGKAASAGDLEAAKSAFLQSILGQDAGAVLGPFQGIVQGLTKAVQSFDPAKVLELLGQIDDIAMQLPAKLQDVLGAAKLAPAQDALRLVQKQVAQ